MCVLCVPLRERRYRSPSIIEEKQGASLKRRIIDMFEMRNKHETLNARKPAMLILEAEVLRADAGSRTAEPKQNNGRSH